MVMIEIRNRSLILPIILVIYLSASIQGKYILNYLDALDEESYDEYEDDTDGISRMLGIKQNTDLDANEDYLANSPRLIPIITSNFLKSASTFDGNDKTFNDQPSFIGAEQTLNHKIEKKSSNRIISSSNVLERMPLTVPVNVYPRWLLAALSNLKNYQNQRTRVSTMPKTNVENRESIDGGYIDDSPGKRSPDCMRRCIAQGILHPVQCHSLC